MGKKKKKIPRPEKNREKSNRVPEPKVNQENEIVFDFSYDKWLKSCNFKDFTTYLKDAGEYAEQITYILSTLIPKISKDLKLGSNLSEFKHCHEVKSNYAVSVYSAAISKIHNVSQDDLNLWQLGINGSTRLICHLSGKKFIPLLVDYHHLGYPSKDHNGKDTSSYDFCPYDSFVLKQ